MDTRLLFLLTCLLPFALSMPPICGPECTFRVCAANEVMFIRKVGTLITIRPPRIAQGEYICQPENPNFLRVNRVGEAHAINENGTTVAISQWRPVGLEVPFPPDFYRVTRVVFQPDFWGVTRVPATGNQLAILHKRCFSLPIRAWTEKTSDGNIRRVRSKREKSDCLSFRTQTVKVYVELAYDSGDIIEIAVQEPDGTIIDKDNVSSGRGRLSDNTNQSCDDQPAGFKNVVFKYPRVEAILPGEYNVTLRHTRNCGRGPTRWSVKVWIDDKKIYGRKGVSDSSGGAIIFEGSYKLKIDSESAALIKG